MRAAQESGGLGDVDERQVVCCVLCSVCCVLCVVCCVLCVMCCVLCVVCCVSVS